MNADEAQEVELTSGMKWKLASSSSCGYLIL